MAEDSQVDDRAAGGYFKKTKAFYISLADLKSSNRLSIFSPIPRVVKRLRAIHNSQVGVAEYIIRFPIDYKEKFRVLLQKFVEFESKFGKNETRVLITANVVLKGEVGPGTPSYSVFYGAAHSVLPGSSGEALYALSGPHTIDNPVELRKKVPINLSKEEILESFEERRINVGSASGTTVIDVINLVAILRKYLPKTKIQAARREGRI